MTFIFTKHCLTNFTQSILKSKKSRLTDVQMFFLQSNKLLCSKHMTVQNLQMNRCLDVSPKIKVIICLDVFTTDQVRCLVKAQDCSKPPDEQMNRCFHHRANKMFCSKDMTVQNPKMNRCLDVSAKIQIIRCLDAFTTEQVRCVAQSI